MRLRNEKGIVLITSYLVITVLIILGSAFISRSISEMRTAERERDSIQAFNIAEGGLEQAIYKLKKDFENVSSPSWDDGNIDGIVVGPDTTNFYFFYGPMPPQPLGDGFYTVKLKNVVDATDPDGIKDNEILIESKGALDVDPITGDLVPPIRTIQVHAKMKNYSPWNNAIFAGVGAGGSTINGHVDIRGSVHLLGTGLGDGDSAIDMGGNANIGNNYQGIPSALEERIPELPTVIFNGETVQSLGAEVRIKNGLAGLSGSATIGEENSSGDSYKETVDGVYITDGYTGNKGDVNVYSDNGTANAYDLGDTVSFPSLSDPYLDYESYQEYLRDNALVISEDAQLSQLNNLTPASSFSYTDGTNTIAIDGNGNLTISGIVYIDGGELKIKESGSNKTITYSGKGTIFATGDVDIEVNLLTSGPDSFPSNVLGIMTPGDIEFDEANIDVMGVFYAEGEIELKKQTNIAGTIVSNYFDIGNQVPSIYQVPSLFDNLPSGIISSLEPDWVMRVSAWQEL